jgi:hypothetical protein
MLNIPLTQTQIGDAVASFFAIGAPGTLLTVNVAVMAAMLVISALRAVFRRK